MVDTGLHRAVDAAVGNGDVALAIRLLERSLPTTPEDFAGWMKLAALRRRSGDAAAALDAVHSAMDARADDVVALLLKGSLHEQLGEPARAAEVYRAVVQHVDGDAAASAGLGGRIGHARDFLARFRSQIEARLSSTARLDPRHHRRARRFRDNVLDRRAIYHQAPTHYRYPDLADIEYFDLAYPAVLDRLRGAFPDILAEFHALHAAHADRRRPYVDFAPGQPVGQWSALNRSADWNALHLMRHGESDPVNAAACPRTMAAFAGAEQAAIPGLGPNLMFSLLAPRTHIPPHSGVANFRVVCHLPLIVPAGCRFRVGADTREWVPGEPWIFDDTIEHEAWNDGDALRVVLIGDLWRPELDETDREIVRDFMRAQGQAQAVDGEIGAL